MARTDANAELGQTYDAAFFDELHDDVASSARAIVPIVCDLVHPRSVLDVGCGQGTWLRVFGEAGVDEVFGVDGPHVDTTQLEIPSSAFMAHDLRDPLSLGRTFDLVTSLEVAEHLDPSLASTFVASLVRHGRVVLFSAAIPFQGGAGHVNEAWPSVWAAHFADHGYVPRDVVRPAVWRNDDVAFWYKQNTLLYLDAAAAESLDAHSGDEPSALPALDVVHPALHTRTHNTPPPAPAPLSLSRVLRELPGAARRAVAHRLQRGESQS
jgi:SAM-dependent methyltransferase